MFLVSAMNLSVRSLNSNDLVLQCGHIVEPGVQLVQVNEMIFSGHVGNVDKCSVMSIDVIFMS
jgi:hypothetical protein